MKASDQQCMMIQNVCCNVIKVTRYIRCLKVKYKHFFFFYFCVAFSPPLVIGVCVEKIYDVRQVNVLYLILCSFKLTPPIATQKTKLLCHQMARTANFDVLGIFFFDNKRWITSKNLIKIETEAFEIEYFSER